MSTFTKVTADTSLYNFCFWSFDAQFKFLEFWLVKHALIVAPERADELQSAARHASVHASSGVRFALTCPL
jgi:hypothetical protein